MLRASGLTKSFGARSLFEGVDLHVRDRDRIGLVGRNGTGKTTLLRMLARIDVPDGGTLTRRRGVTIGYLQQEIDPTAPLTVMEEASKALAPIHRIEREISEVEAEIAELGRRGETTTPRLASRYDELRARFERAGGFEAESNLREILVGLGLRRERWDAPLSTLSGGWLMRVELAKLLVSRPDVLLLDEPTNHLDIPSIRWFEGMLRDYPGAVVVVSHDRAFLDRHAIRIVEIEGRRATAYTGNYTEYREQKVQREAEVEARRTNLDRRIAHAERFVERFGAKASKARQAQSRKKLVEKLRAERDAELGTLTRSGRSMRVRFPKAPRAGERVMRLAGVHKAYGETVIYEGLDLEILRGDRIALVGPNGAGKSTLLRLVAGALPPDAGLRELGHNARAAFYAQHQLEALDPSRTVLAELESAAPLEQIPHLRGILGAFLFSGDDVEKRVSVLSGGEKARLALAKLLLERANLLVLDEPTNHLDIEACDVLCDALRQFDGTLLFISHDRTFINQLANKVLEITRAEGCARARLFLGGYDDYEGRLADEAEARLAAETEEPATAIEHAAPGGEAAPRGPRPRRRGNNRLRQLRARTVEIEAEIHTVESETERLGWASADPEVARDGDRMRALQLERAELQERATRLYTEWERLHGEIEALEQRGS